MDQISVTGLVSFLLSSVSSSFSSLAEGSVVVVMSAALTEGAIRHKTNNINIATLIFIMPPLDSQVTQSQGIGPLNPIVFPEHFYLIITYSFTLSSPTVLHSPLHLRMLSVTA